MPRRVANFVTPMCDIIDNFITHLEGVMDEDGNISNITPEVSKWTFQSNDIRIEATSCILKHTTIRCIRIKKAIN